MFGSLKNYARRLIKPPVPIGPLLIVDGEEPVVKFVDRCCATPVQDVTASSGPEAIETAKNRPAWRARDRRADAGHDRDRLARISGRPNRTEGAVSDRLQRSLVQEKATLWLTRRFDKPHHEGLRVAVSLLVNGTHSTAQARPTAARMHLEVRSSSAP